MDHQLHVHNVKHHQPDQITCMVGTHQEKANGIVAGLEPRDCRTDSVLNVGVIDVMPPRGLVNIYTT